MIAADTVLCVRCASLRVISSRLIRVAAVASPLVSVAREPSVGFYKVFSGLLCATAILDLKALVEWMIEQKYKTLLHLRIYSSWAK